MEHRPDHGGKVCIASLSDTPHDRTLETVSLTMPPDSLQSDRKPRAMSQNLPTNLNNPENVADSDRKPSSVSLNLPMNDPRNVADSETVSLNMPTNSPQKETDTDTKPREVCMNLPTDSNNSQSVADSERNLSTVSLNLLTVPSKPLSAGHTDTRPRAVSLNPVTSNSQSAPEMKTRAMSLNPRGVSDSKTKPRTVSFSVPEDHNESGESARDAVLMYQHTEKGACTATYEDILITRRDGTKVTQNLSESCNKVLLRSFSFPIQMDETVCH